MERTECTAIYERFKWEICDEMEPWLNMHFGVHTADGRMSWLNMQCLLNAEEAEWWNEEMRFEPIFVMAVLMDSHHVIRVWLMDIDHVIRAHVEDIGWDKSKQFQLDQHYKSYQLLPIGSFLVALRPQQSLQNKNENQIENQHDDDDHNHDDEKEDDGHRQRIELHCFVLPEKRKVEYTVKASSMTGYEGTVAAG